MTTQTIPQARPPGSDRDDAIAHIRAALKKRSGKAWSVTGGRGTAWGWIQIDALPARRTWSHRLKAGAGDTWPESYEEFNTGEPGRGHMGPADRAELAALLGLESVHTQGVSIPAQNDFRTEYLDRAEGRPPSRIGKPEWD